jgi:hypothetical protein
MSAWSFVTCDTLLPETARKRRRRVAANDLVNHRLDGNHLSAALGREIYVFIPHQSQQPPGLLAVTIICGYNMMILLESAQRL